MSITTEGIFIRINIIKGVEYSRTYVFVLFFFSCCVMELMRICILCFSAENSKAEKVTEKATTSKTDGKNVKQDSQQKKRSHRSKPYNKRKEKTSNE